MWPTSAKHRLGARVLFRWILAAFFVFAGLNHFRTPDAYIAMIPPWLPRPATLNIIAGICEVMGGIGVLFPSLRVMAGWSLIALLIAVFPANLHVAIMGHMPGFGFSQLILWLRLPFQGVLIAWVAWVSIWGEAAPTNE